eukprot:9497318-Pyramimonas_sp.AAC.1
MGRVHQGNNAASPLGRRGELSTCRARSFSSISSAASNGAAVLGRSGRCSPAGATARARLGKRHHCPSRDASCPDCRRA